MSTKRASDVFALERALWLLVRHKLALTLEPHWTKGNLFFQSELVFTAFKGSSGELLGYAHGARDLEVWLNGYIAGQKSNENSKGVTING